MQWTPRKFRLALLAAAATTALIGCGGGGGGGDDSGMHAASLTTTIEGRAVKGTLKNADVRIYALSGSAERGALLWRGTTDSRGQFTADLGSYSGQYEIVVAAVAGQTRMSCDRPDGCGSVAFGEYLSVSSAFELNAMAQAGTNAGDVAVTPWTAMAAARAKALVQGGASLSEAIEAARSETSAILGFDVSAKPADLTDSDLSDEDAARYAVANAALAGILLQDDTVAANLGDLIDSFRDGAFDESDPVKIGEIKRQLENVIQSPQAEIKLSDKRAELELIASSLPDDTFDPKPTEVVSGNEIEQFKAFTREVRTWLTQIEQTDFSSPWAALRIDFDTVSALMGQENAAMLDQLSDVLGQIEDYVATHTTDVDNAVQSGGTLTIPLTRAEWNGAGYTTVSVGDMAVTFGQQDGKLTASASAAGLNFGASAPTLTIKNLSVLTPVPVSAVQGGTLEPFELSAGEHVLTFSADLENSVGHTARLSDARAALVLTKVVSLPEPSALEPHTIEDAFKTGSFSANAEISDGKGNTFKGSITAEGVRLTVDSVNKANLKSVSLSGSFTGSKGTFEAEATARLNNAELYDWLGVKDYSGSRFVYQRVPASELTGEDLLALSRTYLPDQVNEVFRVASIGNWLGTEGHTFYAETGAVSQASDVPAMTQCLKDHLMDSGYAETWWCGGVDALTFAGIPYPEPAYTNDSVIQEITNLFVRYNTVKVNGVVLEPEVTIYNAHVNSLDNNLYISGELKYSSLEETENRFANVSLTLKGRAALPELPEATMTISGNRSRLDGGSIALKVDWDAGSYTTVIDVDDNSAEKPKAKVAFYNANGMKLVASSPDTSEDVVDVTGEAFVRGTKVGDLSTSEGHYVMRYTDGTFETLY